MAIFCLKNLESPLRVGERLKKAREERGFSLPDISTKTHIPIKYVETIESGKFDNLPPAKAHRLAYIKKYAESLELNPTSFLYQYSKESDLENYVLAHPHRHLKIHSLRSISFVFKNLAIAIAIIGFLSYLVWQINGILKPPKLSVFTPAEGYVSSHLTTLVQGETENEIKLTINGKEIMTNGKGQFEATVDLSNGVNTITISAFKKHGKTTTVTRHVVVKPNSPADKIGIDY